MIKEKLFFGDICSDTEGNLFKIVGGTIENGKKCYVVEPVVQGLLSKTYVEQKCSLEKPNPVPTKEPISFR